MPQDGSVPFLDAGPVGGGFPLSLTLEERVGALEEALERLRQSDPLYAVWHEVGDPSEPAFENSWVNFGTPWETAAYRRDGLGQVYIKGLVKSGSFSQAIFTLPVGFRPAVQILLSTLTSANAVGSFELQADGEVWARSGSNTYLSINCQFYADHPVNLLFL